MTMRSPDQWTQGLKTDEESILDLMFPTSKSAQKLRMLTDLSTRTIMPWSVLGLIEREYNLAILRTLREEHDINKISQERKGRLEASEVVVGMRRGLKAEEE